MKRLGKVVVGSGILLMAVYISTEIVRSSRSRIEPDRCMNPRESIRPSARSRVDMPQELEKWFEDQKRESGRMRFYSRSPSVEHFLGLPKDLAGPGKSAAVLSWAAVVEVGERGSVWMDEHLFGRIPIDQGGSFAPDSPPGRYLIGRVMPRDGWKISRNEARAGFCFRLEDDGSFAYGFEGELAGSLDALRAKIAAMD